MPHWLLVSECVLATVSLSHALPRGNRGVGGLGIQQRQEDLVLTETACGVHNKLVIGDYKTRRAFLILFSSIVFCGDS